MKILPLAALALLSLAGCGAGGNDSYPFSVAETRERLLNGTYEKGSIKGFSLHEITPSATSDTRIEWRLHGSSAGFYCESFLKPANEAGTETRVETGCQYKIAENSMEKLIHSALTGEPFVKDE